MNGVYENRVVCLTMEGYLLQCESKNELVRGTKKSPASHPASYLSNALKLRQKVILLHCRMVYFIQAIGLGYYSSK
jgi:hypothetical protein